MSGDPGRVTVGEVVRVGVLHSLTGTMAISEASLKDAELMAIAEINRSGGVLGCLIEPIIEDGASDSAIFVHKLRKLIQRDQVTTIFGGCTSATRKEAIPVLEELNALLWYPVEYEGLECSPNIFYTGICPNQQVEPAVKWLLENHKKTFYLLGSDYVFPRTANKIIKSILNCNQGKVVGEAYFPLGETDFRSAIADLKTQKPDVVFSTLNGDSNLAFYQQYQQAGILSKAIPIMAVSVAEEELRSLGKIAAGHYAAWSYFQSIDTSINHQFVQRFQSRYGSDRVTSDSIEAAYTQIYIWKQAVEKARSFDVDAVRQAAYGQSFDTPRGRVEIETNNHLAKPSRIGKILPNGQFEIVYDGKEAIKPQPWLGLEELKEDVPPVVFDLLAEVSQGIQYSCQLEEKSRQLEAAMTALMATNERLQQAQNQLQELQGREELLKRRLRSQIRNSLDLDTILSNAVEEIRTLLNIDRCQFLWYHQQSEITQFELTHAACSSELANDLKEKRPIREIPGLANTILNLSWLRIDETSRDRQLDSRTRDRLQSINLASLLAAPVFTRSGQTGVIVCEQYFTPRPWSQQEVELLEAVVDQLAIAIDQAKLYEKSRTAAAIANAQAEQLKATLQELQQTQTQLVQTEKMSSLGQLVAGVAHEINNPASFIYGNLNYANSYTQDLLELIRLYQHHYPNPVPEIQDYSEDIELDFLVEDLPKTLSSMEVGADRIRHLVLSLRNFSRTDRDKMQPINIHEGIDGTLIILNNRLKSDKGRPGIEVIKEYGTLPPVECFPSQLNQVFMNLIGNAIDALEDEKETKQPTIRITTALKDDVVSICIADNGTGMTEEIKEKLFDQFFTTKPIGKGTGLGLSISYSIVVEKHQGKLRCESTPQGTEFWIELPLQQIEAEACFSSSDDNVA